MVGLVCSWFDLIWDLGWVGWIGVFDGVYCFLFMGCWMLFGVWFGFGGCCVCLLVVARFFGFWFLWLLQLFVGCLFDEVGWLFGWVLCLLL